MIFVTVGTHEQPMLRLYEALDRWAASQSLSEPVHIQSGVTSYVFKHCLAKDFLSFQEMERRMREARIVITHGGPATILQAIELGKVPIVVPRLARFQEHVNDHQLDFARRLETLGQILLVVEIDQLADVIRDYERRVGELRGSGRLKSTRGELCQRLTDFCKSIKSASETRPFAQ